MVNKKILGLDIGTNSIGWALIEKPENNTEQGKILGLGSRIISLGEDKTNYEQGLGLSRNAKRRTARGSRKLNKRYKQRRNKLIYVLNALGILPDFIKIDGIFPQKDKIQKLSIAPVRKEHKQFQLTALKLYELRTKALNEKIDAKEFGRLIYLFNQLRGYAGGGENEKDDKNNERDADENTESVKKELEVVKISSINIKPEVGEKKIGKGKDSIIKEIPLYNAVLVNKITNQKYKGRCSSELIIDTEVLVEAVKKTDIDEYYFFNIAGTEYIINKYKNGPEIENLNLIVESCKPTHKYYKKKPQYNITLIDGRQGTLTLNKAEQFEEYKEGAEKELQVITTTDDSGKVSYEFSIPYKTNWRRDMEDLNKKLSEAEKKTGRKIHIGEYFYNELKNDKWYKVRTRVVLRRHYKSEFDAIWKKQIAKNTELSAKLDDTKLLKDIVDFLYPGNNYKENYKKSAMEGGFYELIKNHIIYYQRKLKPQYKLISFCEFENKDRGKEVDCKVIPQSHPLNQERRIWEGINKLSITSIADYNGKKDYIDRDLTSTDKALFFDLLQNVKEITYSRVRSQLDLRDKVDILNGINYSAKIKGNETLKTISDNLSKIDVELFSKLELNKIENLIRFWSILYNWTKSEFDDVQINNNDYAKHPEKFHEYDPNSDDEYDISSGRCKAIKDFASQKNIILTDEQILKISKIRFKRAYASLSAKAINSILPLLRAGEKYFNAEAIPEIAEQNLIEIDDNLDEILLGMESGEDYRFDKSMLERIKKEKLKNVIAEGGMMYSDACSLIYGKHTAKEIKPENSYNNYHQIKTFWKRKQEDPANQRNYLRNPVVEQITDETLQLVYSIWKQYGFKPDEVRIELARELKNNADERAKIYKGINDGEKLNAYVKQRLIELKKSLPKENTVEIEKEIPSQANIEKYKIWRKQIERKNETDGKEPDRSEIVKYKLWSEQHHISPYTLKPIPLSKLFSSDFTIDHIIPKARYFDDSLANKIVCERVVNEEKSNRTPYEYLSTGSKIEGVQNWDTYLNWVNEMFFGQKRKNLTTKEIPQDFISRQLKDTQYVSIKVKEELSEVVGTKNVKTTTGGITDALRQQWGLNDKFKKVTQDRYKAMAKLSGEDETDWVEKIFNKEKNKNIFKIKKWSKRNDHRHHAIDALVVACTEQAHVQRLNNLNKIYQSWFGEFDLFVSENKIEELKDIKGTPEEIFIAFSAIEEERRKEVSRLILDSIIEKQKTKNKKRGDWEKWFFTFYSLEQTTIELIQKSLPGFRRIEKPWKDFYKDEVIEKLLESIVVSHKPNNTLRIQKQRDENGKIRIDKKGKEVIGLRIRGELHEGTLMGTVKEGEFIGQPFYRVKLNSLGSNQKSKSAVEGTLKRVISPSLRLDLQKHLNDMGGNVKAFSAEGIDKFNFDRKEAKKHPVYAVKVVTEDKPKQLFRDKNNKSLFAKTGSNYCFAICERDNKRVYDVIPFYDAANLLKSQLSHKNNSNENSITSYFENKNEKTKGCKLLFTLSANDLVFVPEDSEKVAFRQNEVANSYSYWQNINKKRIFKVVRMDSSYCYFIPHNFTGEIKYKPIFLDNSEKENNVSYNEFDTYNGCSPNLRDDSFYENKNISNRKKRLKEQISILVTSITKLKPDIENKEKELLDELVNIITINSSLDSLKLLKEINSNYANIVKQHIYESKEKEIDGLVFSINNAQAEIEKDEIINSIAKILLEFDSFIDKKNFNKKYNLISKQVIKVVKEYKSKQEKFKGTLIQDICIKIEVDRLGNVKPA